MKKFKEKMKNLWDYFSTYELCWLITIIGLSIFVTILFPSVVDDLDVHPYLIIALYLLDVILNVTCELLISKQSKWNFIVSLFVEITEIITLIVISARFATMAVTIFFWIPVDIISFVNWHLHKDRKEEELTVVRTLKGWQEILIILAIVVWTVGVGYLLTIITPDGILEANSTIAKVACYLDAFASAVGVCNGLFILFRYREQWIAWYICAGLETILNIIYGQWVLLVLKAGYFTNTTYGYIKWTKYIKEHTNEVDNQENDNPCCCLCCESTQNDKEDVECHDCCDCDDTEVLDEKIEESSNQVKEMTNYNVNLEDNQAEQQNDEELETEPDEVIE